jgi:hypothetical protein
MKVLMFYQITLYTDSLMTLIGYMHTQHYVSLHALPEDTLTLIPYYTYKNEHSPLWIYVLPHMFHRLNAILHTSWV